MSALSFGSAHSAWDVFLLFAIPVGGGIPAGVVLAQSKGMGWAAMSVLYLASDLALACLFEPLMMAFAFAAKRFRSVARVRELIRASNERSVALYGSKPGPVALIAISFGVDPMTGRAAAYARGHSFLTGWAIAILGDMLFFALIMASTIWLESVLGDGTWTAIIIMVAMLVIPGVARRLKSRWTDSHGSQN